MSVKRGESWKPDEDIALCKAVVNIGEDGDTATGQAKSRLWERIAAVYMTLKPETSVARLGGSCEARWRRIRPACTKWREALTKAEAAISSGQNATDMELQAKSIYRSLNKGKEFMFSHCWGILHDTMKFCSPLSLDDYFSGPSPISLDDDNPTETLSASSSRGRPIGQKAQKLAKKAKATEGTQLLASEIHKLNEIYEREVEQSKHLIEVNRLRAERLEEDNVMSKNPADYPEPMKSYWKNRQRIIIEKMQQQESSREQEGPSHNDEGYIPTTDDWI